MTHSGHWTPSPLNLALPSLLLTTGLLLTGCPSEPIAHPAPPALPAPSVVSDSPGSREVQAAASGQAPKAPVPTETGHQPAEAIEADAKQRLRKLLDYDPNDPLGNLEAADALAGDVAAATLEPGGPCSMVGPAQRLYNAPTRLAVAPSGTGFVVASYSKKANVEQIRLLQIPPSGPPEPLPPIQLSRPYGGTRSVAPALAARNDHELSLAYVDGKGDLFLSSLSPGRPASAARKLHGGLDARYAPALTHVQAGTIVAFTLGTTPMKTMVARVPAGHATPKLTDVTPPGLGAAGPVVVQGAQPPLLLALDARAAISHVLKIAFSKDGVPAVGQIAAPVGMVSSPANMAAVQQGNTVHVGYTGIGSGATSAIGLVEFFANKNGSSTPPRALIKGTAYGPLHLDALALPTHATLFAADAPQTPGKHPKHDIKLMHINADGQEQTTYLRGGPHGAHNARLAQSSHSTQTTSGTIALTYSTNSATYLQRLRCR